jgi:hypothetical protein
MKNIANVYTDLKSALAAMLRIARQLEAIELIEGQTSCDA